MNVQIDSHIKPPKEKGSKFRHEQHMKRHKIFKAFALSYEKLHIIKPDRFTYSEDSKMMSVYAGDRLVERAGVKRIEQLTRLNRDRAAVRDAEY